MSQQRALSPYIVFHSVSHKAICLWVQISIEPVSSFLIVGYRVNGDLESLKLDLCGFCLIATEFFAK